ncbi:MAG TPA: undecaprenyldiphospho-muramoylpentapeptide beta-N-acetylglucosaminyltransferase [Rectinemataceae bacterium]
MSRTVIAFTGGGTGGHIYPGLAVIQALKARGFSGSFVWIGSEKEMDRKIVEGEGIEYRPIPSGKLRRSLSLENIADAFRVIAGYSAALRILKEIRPAFLFSKGGYVSVPPCRAAASLGIPYFTHESDFSPGLATRLNASKAEAVLVSWDKTASLLPKRLAQKCVTVGNPVRPELFLGRAEAGRAFLSVPESMPLVVVLGGSQGSKQLNDIVAAILPALEGRAFVFHQTGSSLFDPELHRSRPGAYMALPYLGKEMRDVLAAGDIALGRAGAGTVWECSIMGLPMVLIPLMGSGTRGDQVENARAAQEVGAAISLEGDEAQPEKVLAALNRLLENPYERAKAKAACLALARAKASAKASDIGSEMGSAGAVADMILSRLASA